MSTTLPNELVAAIFSLVDSLSDRLQLARVSRQFNMVGRPHVWRELRARIRTSVTLRRLNSTLLKDAALAESVREFDIPFVLVRPEFANFQFQRIPTLIKILPRLNGLRTLIINLGSGLVAGECALTGIKGDLARLPTFPQLQHLMVRSSRVFLYFALRHSTIVAIHLVEHLTFFVDDVPQPEDVDTSRYQPLEYLTVQGPCVLHQHLIPGRTQADKRVIGMYRPFASTCSFRIDSPAWLNPEFNLIDSLERHESLSSCSLHLPNADFFDLTKMYADFVSASSRTVGSTNKVRSLRIGFMGHNHDEFFTFIRALTRNLVLIANMFPGLKHLEFDELARWDNGINRHTTGQSQHEPGCSYVGAMQAGIFAIFDTFEWLQSLRWPDGETFRRSSDNPVNVMSEGVRLRRPSHYFPLHVDV